MTKLLARTLAAAALVLGATASAAEFPPVYLTSVSLDQPGSFAAGSTVTGKFTLQNQGEENVSLPATLHLMFDFRDGFPRQVVDSYTLSPVTVGAHASAEAPFSVALPKAYTGQFWVVAAVDIISGRERVSPPAGPFEATGGIARAQIVGSRLVLSDGRTAGPFTGPSIFREKEPSSVSLSVDVLSREALSVKPAIQLFEAGQDAGEPIWEGAGEVAAIVAGATTTVKATLPDLGYPDKVIFGTYRLVDQDGVDRSGLSRFRYVPRTGAPIGRILSLSVSAEGEGAGRAVASGLVAGNPPDVFTMQTDSIKANFRLEVLDAAGEVVAMGESPIEAGPGSEPVEAAAELPSNLSFATYRVTLVDQATGRELDREEGPLFGEESGTSSSRSAMIALGVTLAVAVVGSALIYLMFFRRRALPAAATLAVALAFALPTSALAWDSDVSARLDFSQPVAAPATYQCGAPIPVYVTAAFDVCSNTGGTGVLTVTLPGVGEVARQNVNLPATGGHVFFDAIAATSVTMPTPVRNGDYTLTARFVGEAADGAFPYNVSKDHTFRIEGCDQCPNLSGDQGTVPSGMVKVSNGDCECRSGLNWNATTGRCEGDDDEACPDGKKWCNGACVDDSVNCEEISGCPFEPEGRQYCVQIFDEDGDRTNQLGSFTYANPRIIANLLSNEDLEKMFGFGIREAYLKQLERIEAGLSSAPIFGVVGRSVSNSVTSTEGSAGCAGLVCPYGVSGCLTTIDPGSGTPVGNCTPLNDIPGPAGVAPQANIEVEPGLVGKGGRCQVYWGSHEMRSCQLSGPGLASGTLAGSTTTPPLDASATYNFVCTGVDGNTYRDSDSCAVDPSVREF